MSGLTPGSAQTELLIGEVFGGAAQSAPNRVAVSLGERSLTFGEIDRSSNRLGRGLRDLGVGLGGRVAVVGATNLDLVSLFAATAKLGAVYAAIDPRLEVPALVDLLAVARPSVVVIDDERATWSGDLAAALDAPAIGLARLVRSSAGDDDGELSVSGLRELDPQSLLFSSSGTGRPKAVVLSHRAQYLRTQLGAPRSRDESAVCSYPLADPIAWEIILRQWHARAHVALLDAHDPSALCDAVGRHGAAHVTASLSFLRETLAFVASDRDKASQLGSLRRIDVVGAALPSQILDTIASVLPRVRLRLVYRRAEAGDLACAEGPDLRAKPGSCGIPSSFAEVRIERTGELCVRGPLLFDGYFDDADATAAAVVDGWYHTGDVGEIDGEGWLTILGRVRDVIRTPSGGVVPIEVETAIASHVGVGDVAVVGLPDGDLGHMVCAVVVPAPGHDPPSLADLRSFCESRIESFKRPNRLIVVDAIPRTEVTNQVKRPLLSEQLAAQPLGG